MVGGGASYMKEVTILHFILFQTKEEILISEIWIGDLPVNYEQLSSQHFDPKEHIGEQICKR